MLNQPIARQGEKPAWWLALVKADRKRKEMYCPPAPAAERIQITAERAGGTQSNTVAYLNNNCISYIYFYFNIYT